MVSGASYTNYNYREFSFYHHFVAELFLSDLWKWLYFDNKYKYKAWSQLSNINFETGYKFNPKIEQDCLLQGQAQLDQRVVFRFCTLRLRSKKEGGLKVPFDKNGNLGLKYILSHFKQFKQILLSSSWSRSGL